MLTEQNTVSRPLLDLIRKLVVWTEERDPSPQELNAVLQEKWVGTKEGLLRAQIQGRFPAPDELVLLEKMGLAGRVEINHEEEYKGILLLGATVKAMARRMGFIQEEFTPHLYGEDIPEIWFLGSVRPLNDNLEGPSALPKIIEETRFELLDDDKSGSGEYPKTESGAFLMLKRRNRWWMNKSVHIIAGPPNTKTGDAVVIMFLQSDSPKTGRYLVVSSQPFCQNQLLTVRRAAMGYKCEFDVCGPAAPPLPLPRWLDTIAKQLWEEIQNL